MPRKPIDFSLDFMIKDIFSRFTVKQYDDVSFNITPLIQNKPYDTTNMKGKIFVGVNGDMFMQDTNITVSSNNINVLLDKNMLQKQGRAYAEIELTDNNGTITSSSFIFDIDPKIGEGGQIPGEYEGFVAKYERLIAEFKTQVNNAVINNENKTTNAINALNTNISTILKDFDNTSDNKLNDIENRFQRLTTSQQQDTEVIDARTDIKGKVHTSLKDRLDNISDELVAKKVELEVSTEKRYAICENTNNGQIEELKFKGNTFVNIAGTITHAGQIPSQNLYNLPKDFLTKVKPSTTYTVHCANLSGKETHFAIFNNSTTIGILNQTPITLVNNSMTLKFTTPSEISQNINCFFFRGNNFTEEDKKSLNFLMLEGDHTQNLPSYFEGLKSVGDGVDKIEISSRKEDGNLFDGELELGDLLTNTGGLVSKDTTVRSVNFIKILPTQNYYLSATNGYNSTSGKVIYFYDSDKKYITQINEKGQSPSNAFYCKIRTRKDNSTTITYEEMKNIKIMLSASEIHKEHIFKKIHEKQVLYKTKEETYEKPILRGLPNGVKDTIEKHSDGKYYFNKRCEQRVYQANDETKADVITDKTNTVYQLATEEVYECVNLDLDSYEGETSVIVDSGAISPKMTFKIASHIANTISVLKDRINYLEDKVINMLKAVLAGDVQTLAYELYPEDFETDIKGEEIINDEIELL